MTAPVVGGPPRAARHVRTVTVLVAAPTHGCAFPGAPGRRDDRADEHGQPLPLVRARPVSWTHAAHRAAIAEAMARRALERRVVVWEQDGVGWWVAVHDGWGRVVDDYTPAPYTFDDVREVANAAVEDLHAQAAAAPWQWSPTRPHRSRP